jgi:hypothetical protein
MFWIGLIIGMIVSPFLLELISIMRGQPYRDEHPGQNPTPDNLDFLGSNHRRIYDEAKSSRSEPPYLRWMLEAEERKAGYGFLWLIQNSLYEDLKSLASRRSTLH